MRHEAVERRNLDAVGRVHDRPGSWQGISHVKRNKTRTGGDIILPEMPDGEWWSENTTLSGYKAWRDTKGR